MSGPERMRTEPDVRMNVKVSRRDFPLLTEEIASLPKGPRRTNRLAHLATLGLCWERAVAGLENVPREKFRGPGPAGVGSGGTDAYRSRLDAAQLTALFDDGGGP